MRRVHQSRSCRQKKKHASQNQRVFVHRNHHVRHDKESLVRAFDLIRRFVGARTFRACILTSSEKRHKTEHVQCNRVPQASSRILNYDAAPQAASVFIDSSTEFTAASVQPTLVHFTLSANVHKKTHKFHRSRLRHWTPHRCFAGVLPISHLHQLGQCLLSIPQEAMLLAHPVEGQPPRHPDCPR